MPFSRSRSMESMTRSATSAPARNAPVCHSMASTSVVLPWSTCATMATLRRSSRVGMHPVYGRGDSAGRDQLDPEPDDVGVRGKILVAGLEKESDGVLAVPDGLFPSLA